ncbi:hypothetical protein CLV63_102261 [Murinocardiopsis flavida]|uniref:DUF1152 domain-containing protein n=1 Tax=Murinocardiopsis flavida TaxID=645275 RepID=A0A2P8DSG4_9ACTN|nr:DUF1152 domain-containing protein [Murinocardiopsis flavida]PSL00135.1 hypothetical protein CLV63_102261 [Murinocardiopsis flavida]
MRSLNDNPLFHRLDGARSVLVAGAGGGFDIYAGLPLALALRRPGRSVHLANLSFARLDPGLDWIGPDVAAVGPDSPGDDRYFPERTLARWLADQGLPPTVHALRREGARRVGAGYRALAAHLDIDAVVLADGGTDILMRGDEAGLGTPEEDITSLAAVAALDVPVKTLACIGFGVDAYHGVSHSLFLENVAALEREGGHLGVFSVPRDSAEGAAYLAAVEHASGHTPQRPSIVNGSIAAAVRGEFGDVRFTRRTGNGELFINPLMSLYFAFDLAAVARRCLYLDLLASTDTFAEVQAVIESFRYGLDGYRPRRAFPH